MLNRPNAASDLNWYRYSHWEGFDGSTICAWRRTWHGPNALATPLRSYYMPRVPSYCCGHSDGIPGPVVYGSGCIAYANGCNGCVDGCGCSVGESFAMPGGASCQCQNGPVSSAYPPEAAIGFQPTQFERLGRIANELDPPAAAGTPGRTQAGSRVTHSLPGPQLPGDRHNFAPPRRKSFQLNFAGSSVRDRPPVADNNNVTGGQSTTVFCFRIEVIARRRIGLR